MKDARLISRCIFRLRNGLSFLSIHYLLLHCPTEAKPKMRFKRVLGEPFFWPRLSRY